MEYNNQLTGGKLEIPNGWVVYSANLDADEPYIVIIEDRDVLGKNERKISVPKSLAYYLSTHFCGSKRMAAALKDSAERALQHKLKKLIGIKD